MNLDPSERACETLRHLAGAGVPLTAIDRDKARRVIAGRSLEVLHRIVAALEDEASRSHNDRISAGLVAAREIVLRLHAVCTCCGRDEQWEGHDHCAACREAACATVPGCNR